MSKLNIRQLSVQSLQQSFSTLEWYGSVMQLEITLSDDGKFRCRDGMVDICVESNVQKAAMRVCKRWRDRAMLIAENNSAERHFFALAPDLSEGHCAHPMPDDQPCGLPLSRKQASDNQRCGFHQPQLLDYSRQILSHEAHKKEWISARISIEPFRSDQYALIAWLGRQTMKVDVGGTGRAKGRGGGAAEAEAAAAVAGGYSAAQVIAYLKKHYFKAEPSAAAPAPAAAVPSSSSSSASAYASFLSSSSSSAPAAPGSAASTAGGGGKGGAGAGAGAGAPVRKSLGGGAKRGREEQGGHEPHGAGAGKKRKSTGEGSTTTTGGAAVGGPGGGPLGASDAQALEGTGGSSGSSSSSKARKGKRREGGAEGELAALLAQLGPHYSSTFASASSSSSSSAAPAGTGTGPGAGTGASTGAEGSSSSSGGAHAEAEASSIIDLDGSSATSSDEDEGAGEGGGEGGVVTVLLQELATIGAALQAPSASSTSSAPSSSSSASGTADVALEPSSAPAPAPSAPGPADAHAHAQRLLLLARTLALAHVHAMASAQARRTALVQRLAQARKASATAASSSSSSSSASAGAAAGGAGAGAGVAEKRRVERFISDLERQVDVLQVEVQGYKESCRAAQTKESKARQELERLQKSHNAAPKLAAEKGALQKEVKELCARVHQLEAELGRLYASSSSSSHQGGAGEGEGEGAVPVYAVPVSGSASYPPSLGHAAAEGQGETQTQSQTQGEGAAPDALGTTAAQGASAAGEAARYPTPSTLLKLELTSKHLRGQVAAGEGAVATLQNQLTLLQAKLGAASARGDKLACVEAELARSLEAERRVAMEQRVACAEATRARRQVVARYNELLALYRQLKHPAGGSGSGSSGTV